MAISRRTFLKAGLGVGVVGAVGIGYQQINKVKTQAKIVIVGGGAAGIGAANQLNNHLDGATITIIEPREYHWYQPGQTLLLAGAYTKVNDVLSSNQRFIDPSIQWLQDTVIEYRPDHNQVMTEKGEVLDYDFLLIATGVELRYDLIEGFDPREIGQNGVTSIYYSPEAGLLSHQQAQLFTQGKGGKAVFTRPQGAMKCAGAPIKATNLVEDFAQQHGNRQAFTFDYFTAENSLFSVKVFDEKIREIWNERAITAHFQRTLTALDTSNKKAIFTLADDSKQVVDWDFIHVAPPMTAVKSIRESTLADNQRFHGYLDVDQFTMQHKQYSNIFGLGDNVGTPIGKTAASVKSQIPVVTQNLIAVLSDKPLNGKWDGYTSCPMILGVGRAMLWEFDYQMQPTTALPFHIVDPLKSSHFAWKVKESVIKPIYDMMLRGYTPM